MDNNAFLAERIQVTERLRQLLATSPTDEQLVQFFNEPGPYRHFGAEGDQWGWTPRQTAEHFQSKHFNGLTPAEAERLALLSEELSEAGQVIGKILRHGFDSSHPDALETTNRDLLENELGDVTAAIEMMVEAGDLNTLRIAEMARQKRRNVRKYLHHN